MRRRYNTNTLNLQCVQVSPSLAYFRQTGDAPVLYFIMALLLNLNGSQIRDDLLEPYIRLGASRRGRRPSIRSVNARANNDLPLRVTLLRPAHESTPQSRGDIVIDHGAVGLAPHNALQRWGVECERLDRVRRLEILEEHGVLEVEMTEVRECIEECGAKAGIAVSIFSICHRSGDALACRNVLEPQGREGGHGNQGVFDVSEDIRRRPYAIPSDMGKGLERCQYGEQPDWYHLVDQVVRLASVEREGPAVADDVTKIVEYGIRGGQLVDGKLCSPRILVRDQRYY